MRPRTAWRAGAGLALAVVLSPSAAWATWSIVAVDPVTREVGVAGASCAASVDGIAGLVPGKGALAAQGSTNAAARDRGLAELRAGRPPAAILAVIARPQFDPRGFLSGLDYRQYGIASLAGGAPANFTGAKTFAWAGALTGPNVTVQGNILRSPAVAKAALAAFQSPPHTPSPDLADRLLAALEAGSRQGGDRRCAADLTALSAFVKVAGPDDPAGRPRLDLVVRSPHPPKSGTLRLAWQLWVRPEPAAGRPNPVASLRAEYDRRRAAARRR